MPSSNRPSPVLLDVDPGIDDSLAILLALRSPEIELVAITVVAGNVDVEQGLENALKVVELAGARSLPVAKGAASPLVGKLTTARHVHGENGLGDVQLPISSLEPYPGPALRRAGRHSPCEHRASTHLRPVSPPRVEDVRTTRGRGPSPTCASGRSGWGCHGRRFGTNRNR